jgi:hypothetical protein
MRTSLLILFTFVLITAVGQNFADTIKTNVPVFYGDRLKPFLDSLKTKLFTDTAKFKQTDLIFTVLGRRNTEPYSPLFIINGAYIYKLDIISGLQVVSFVNEILDNKKIKSITYIDSSQASKYFGQNAWKGVILITMFDRAKFNLKVAGLTTRKNKSGDNFTVRKKYEILIRD